MPDGLREPDWPRRLTPTVAQEPLAVVPGSFTLAVLPDTQYYAQCRSAHLERQSEWVASQKQSRNIQAALTLGDLTENNTEAEWAFVKTSLAPLFDTLPTFLATGNHDYGDGGTANRRFTLFQRTFPEAPPGTVASLVETKDVGDIENAYYRIEIGALSLGVLVLEWSPRTATVGWANEVLERHAADRVIFITHAYLYYDGTRYDDKAKGETQKWNPRVYGTAFQDPKTREPSPAGAYDGEMLWQELLSRHESVFLTLNGHVLGDGAGVLSSPGMHGNIVHQVLVNYQMLAEGGLGYLRLLEFLPDGATLRMKTYSPSLDVFATAPDQNFELSIVPGLW
jgi:hypothetical protein